MNTHIRGLVALGGVLVLGFIAGGCYTQLGSVRDDPQEDAVDEEQYAYDDSTTVDDYENVRRQFYYDYYYPSVMVGIGFGSPWYGGFHSPYGYYSPWVDPWYGWCGSTYPGYYGYWDNPFRGYGTYYGHAGTYRAGNGGYVVRGSGTTGGTRTIGSTRSSGSTLGTGALPTGVRSNTPVGKTGSVQLPTGSVSTGRRGQSGERQSVTGTRTGTGASGKKETPRSQAPRSNPRPNTSDRPERVSSPVAPPQGASSPGRESGRGGNDRSGGGSSYSPPSPSPSSPPPSSPPPSGNTGGKAPANTGSRGGDRR